MESINEYTLEQPKSLNNITKSKCMPTIIDMVEYIIALRQEVNKKDNIIQQLNQLLETNNKGKKNK